MMWVTFVLQKLLRNRRKTLRKRVLFVVFDDSKFPTKTQKSFWESDPQAIWQSPKSSIMPIQPLSQIQTCGLMAAKWHNPSKSKSTICQFFHTKEIIKKSSRREKGNNQDLIQFYRRVQNLRLKKGDQEETRFSAVAVNNQTKRKRGAKISI